MVGCLTSNKSDNLLKNLVAAVQKFYHMEKIHTGSGTENVAATCLTLG